MPTIKEDTELCPQTTQVLDYEDSMDEYLQNCMSEKADHIKVTGDVIQKKGKPLRHSHVIQNFKKHKEPRLSFESSLFSGIQGKDR